MGRREGWTECEERTDDVLQREGPEPSVDEGPFSEGRKWAKSGESGESGGSRHRVGVRGELRGQHGTPGGKLGEVSDASTFKIGKCERGWGLRWRR